MVTANKRKYHSPVLDTTHEATRKKRDAVGKTPNPAERRDGGRVVVMTSSGVVSSVDRLPDGQREKFVAESKVGSAPPRAVNGFFLSRRNPYFFFGRERYTGRARWGLLAGDSADGRTDDSGHGPHQGHVTTATERTENRYGALEHSPPPPPLSLRIVSLLLVHRWKARA